MKMKRVLRRLIFSTIAYMRFTTRWAYPEEGILGQYHCYRRAKESPTGVLHVTTFTATKRIDAMIDARRLCTLSPTEGR